MIRRWFLPLFVVSLSFLACGCPPAAKVEKSVQVSGKVNLDGKPLEEGDITFVGSPGSVPDTLQVRGGTFEGQAKVGKKKVEIRAYKKEKPPPSSTAGVTEMQVNFIPSRFNTETTLSTDVGENGGLSPDTFDVKSK